jgi:excisionase family DNA binding protein
MEHKEPKQETESGNVGSDDILDMEQAIDLLKTTRPTFYRWLRAGKFKGMKVGRQWRFYRKDIEAFLRGEGPRIALPANITPLIDQLGGKYRELGGDKVDPPGRDELEQVAHLMAAIVLRMRASDVHLHAHGASEAVVRLRVDGVLYTVARFDPRLLPPLIEQWKALTSADLNEKQRPQDGHGFLAINDTPLDVRSSFLPTPLGESMTLRVLRRDAGASFSLDKLGFSPRELEILRQHLKAPVGLVVVTGPSGCGKTTTHYSGLTYLNQPEIKIMTAEDPVEVIIDGTVQANVREDITLTFPAVLKSLFRHDPDVILVGEVRDKETLEICCKGAIAGHLVLTSMHSPDAASALRRMRDILGPSQFDLLVGDTMCLVLAQRLLRCVCPDCAESYDPPQEMLDEIEMRACMGGLDWSPIPKHFRKGAGCISCAQTGYRGRTGVAEALPVTPPLLAALHNEDEPEGLLNAALQEGMVTLATNGAQRAAEGVTTIDEVLRVFAS